MTRTPKPIRGREPITPKPMGWPLVGFLILSVLVLVGILLRGMT